MPVVSWAVVRLVQIAVGVAVLPHGQNGFIYYLMCLVFISTHRRLVRFFVKSENVNTIVYFLYSCFMFLISPNIGAPIKGTNKTSNLDLKVFFVWRHVNSFPMDLDTSRVCGLLFLLQFYGSQGMTRHCKLSPVFLNFADV